MIERARQRAARALAHRDVAWIKEFVPRQYQGQSGGDQKALAHG